MKYLYFVYAVLLFSAFTSCKKDDNKKPDSTNPSKPVIAAVRDSVSYTIDGQTYTAGGFDVDNVSSSGGEDANRKLVYPDKNNIHAYSLVGNPDSVMYFQKIRIFTNSVNMNVFFLKKYVRQNQGLYWMPGLKDVLKLFTVGKHPLAEDFEWQNSQNGVAIDVAAGNIGSSSYNAYNGPQTIAFPAGFQKNSTFEITSFTPTTTGNGYNLEAKFTAVVFTADGQQKTLENGYLRVNFGIWYNTLAK